jgi:hypothetical protein
LGQLNFVQFLSCVLRLALISYGSLGLSPEEVVTEIGKDMHLGDVHSVKERLLRIARTNAGFGGWVDENMAVERSAEMALNMKRSRSLEGYMLPREQMLRLQVPDCRTLSCPN